MKSPSEVTSAPSRSSPESGKSLWSVVQSLQNDVSAVWQFARSQGDEPEADSEHDGEDEKWRSYSTFESLRIEQAFQKGLDRCRLKSGGHRDSPIEIFFYDNMQYDPCTGLSMQVRRVGHEGICQKAARRIRRYLQYLKTGSQGHKQFLKYKQGFWNEGSSLGPQEAKKPRSEFCKRIAQGILFSSLQPFMIVLSVIVVGVDVELSNSRQLSSSEKFWMGLINYIMCAFFISELTIGFGAMNKKKNVRGCLKQLSRDWWFIFEFMLVCFMLVEIFFDLYFHDDSNMGSLSVLRLLRLVRIARVGRIARLLKICPDLFILLKSIFAAMRAVATTLVLLVCFLYLFAVMFMIQLDGVSDALKQLFPSITGSMLTLLVHGAFMDDVGSTMAVISAESPECFCLFLLFIFLSNLTVLNMLIGIICEVASDVSRKEKENRDTQALRKDLFEFLDCFDLDSDQQVDLAEFELLFANPDVIRMLERHGVDVHTLYEIKDEIFEIDDGGDAKLVSFDELLVLMLRFRTGQGLAPPATVLDIFHLEKSITSCISKQLHQIIPTKENGMHQVSLHRQNSKIQRNMLGKGPGVLENSPLGAALGKRRTPERSSSSAAAPTKSETCPHLDAPVGPAFGTISSSVATPRKSETCPHLECSPEASSPSPLDPSLESAPEESSLPAPAHSGPREGEQQSSEASDKIYAEGMSSEGQVVNVKKSSVPEKWSSEECKKEMEQKFQEIRKILDLAIANTGLLSMSSMPASDTNLVQQKDGELRSLVTPEAHRTFKRRVCFDSNVERLKFQVEWQRPMPVVNAVESSGQADHQAILVGDSIAALNGVVSDGKGRNDLLPKFKERPLAIEIHRSTVVDPKHPHLELNFKFMDVPADLGIDVSQMGSLPVVCAVREGSIAWQEGVLVGDAIWSINCVAGSANHMSVVAALQQRPLTLTLRRRPVDADLAAPWSDQLSPIPRLHACGLPEREFL